ncbi:MAG TPA: TonB-dependent receptor plug domain-containing protein [Verrucomicrobiae bacterium]|nr:TonB-dependent receptor plug domain-containing protein [Verrucomicrobiae bacterium]
MIKKVLNKFGFVRIAIVASVGFPFILASNALAQDPPAAPAPAAAAPPAPAAEVERVIVTGSLIPTAEEVGPNPVFSINRDLINKSGAGTTTEQLLQRQPVMGGSNIPVNNNGVAQSGPAGTAALSLRGLDPGATLVMIDRRRVAVFPGSANSGYGFVDLTTIPITAVQSIDILKDGASTTYGADAVAGVVNFNLYKDYRGAQVTIQYGDTLDKDAAEYRGDILFGVGDDKTSITGDMFYYKHHDMFNHDRGNSLVPPFLSSNAVPWNLQLQVAAIIAAGGTPFPTASSREFGTPPDNANGLVPASDYIYYFKRPRAAFSILPGFNFNLYSSSYPKQERWGGYAAFETKICDDQFRIFGDFYYVDGKTHDELAPLATGSFETPGSPTIFVPPNSPFPGGVPPFGGPTSAEVGMSPTAFNPFNPFEQIISGGTRARIFDFGNRLIDNENIAERFTVGVKGDKLFNGTWGYDGAFMYSQIQNIAKAQLVSAPRFEQIMNAADPIFDPTSSVFIGQTVPYNPFVDTQHVVFPTNLPLIEYAIARTRDLFTMKLATLDMNVYTTDLFDLPAGGVGLAFGGVFSRESYTIDPDDQDRLGTVAGGAVIGKVKAGRKEWSVYAETLVPIFSPKFNIPGFYSLEFSAGVRFEDWLNNDTNAAVPKVGVRWQPFDEQLTLRSTWGEGFLEPSMVQLYGPRRFVLGPLGGNTCAPGANGFISTPCDPSNPSFQSVTNPETTIENLPNRNLHPEHDRSWTGGVVYTPKWIPSKYGTLTLTVDFWDVERSGVAMFLSPSSILTGYNQGIFPGIVSPAQPTLSSPPAALFDPEGGFSGVSSPYLNGGRTRTNGVDLGAQYQIETGFGTFSLLSRWSYLNEMVVNFPGARPRQAAGSSSAEWFIGNFFGDVTNPQAWLKWKGDTTVDWNWHNVDFNVTVHTLDGYWEQIYAKQFDGFWKRHWVHPTWFTDAQLSYSLIFTPPVEAAPVPGYSKGGKEVVGKEKEAPPVPYAMPCWKNILNNTTLTVGVNDIFGEDPPKSFAFELGNSIGYPGSLYDNLGRFVYVRMIKKF